jgi:imidazolonepropionase-like amidohydrolase
MSRADARALRILRSAGAAVAALTMASAAAQAQRTLVRAGRLLDPVTGRVSRDQVILVEQGRVTAVGGGIREAEGDSVVDLSGYTVLPGLIDAHVHLAIGGPVRDNALASLQAGFTTVMDLGARTTRILAIRDSIDAGLIPGPRVLAAGIWIGRKDGVCEFNGIGIAGGADAFRRRVRENVAARADVIKACVSGWPADAYAHPDAYEMPDSVLAAIVDESRRLGRRVIAHAISIGSVRAALRAGVHGLAHSAYIDSATAKEMRERGMFLISTLASLAGNDSSAASRALVASTRLAYRTGVPLVFGTDAGVIPHGSNAQEFAALVAAGVAPLDAIRSATLGAARALRLADSLGTIAPGMIADVIAVEGDVLSDVTSLQRVRFVMLKGRVAKRPQP